METENYNQFSTLSYNIAIIGKLKVTLLAV